MSHREYRLLSINRDLAQYKARNDGDHVIAIAKLTRARYRILLTPQL